MLTLYYFLCIYFILFFLFCFLSVSVYKLFLFMFHVLNFLFLTDGLTGFVLSFCTLL